MDAAAWLLLMLLAGNWRPAPAAAPLLLVSLEFATDRQGQRAIQALEAQGDVIEMIEFTGRSASLIYRPRETASALTIPAGVRVQTRPARAK